VYSCDFRILPWLLQNAAACQNVWGFTGLCSHDIDPRSCRCRTMAVESAGWGFSLRSPGDSRQRAFQNGRRGRLEHRETIYGPGESRVLPAIVLQRRAGDKAYLKSRGIEELLEGAVR
jgi:hypothetical protein